MHLRSRPRTAVLVRAGAGLAVASLALTGCTSDTPEPTGSSASSAAAGGTTVSVAEELENAGKVDGADFCGTEPITLGIHDGFGVNAWSQASMAAVRSEAAKCPNVKEVVAIGEGDLQKSISQVNSMVAQGVDALVIIPDFGEAQLPSIRAATNAGVKVVPWGADPGGNPGQDYVTYVDWESPDAGSRWAEWMVDTLGGKGNIIMLGGPAGNPVTAGQLKSIVEVVEANPGITLLTGEKDWPVTNWDPATAQKVMSSLLARYPQIDGIISDYGTDALAATRAMQSANRPLVPIATLDANGLSCLYAKEKANQPKLELATISSRNWLGRIAARKAIAAAAGVPNNEPSTFQLPIIEDSTGTPKPVCRDGLADDYYNSNQIEPAEIAQYGKP